MFEFALGFGLGFASGLGLAGVRVGARVRISECGD